MALHAGFTGDGGTQASMGGCWSRPQCTVTQYWVCQWPMSHLRDAIATQVRVGGGMYNEYVVSKDIWESNLPGIIDAIVCRDECSKAKGVHLAFLARFGLSAEEIPLVYYAGSRIGFQVIADHLTP